MFSNLNKPPFGTAAPGTSFGLGGTTANNAWGNSGNNQIFGKPTTTAFGQQPSTSFGQPSTSSTTLFPFFSQTSSSGFGSTTTTQPAFGIFGTQPAVTNPLFGSTNSFGQQKPTGFGFGTQAQQQPTNVFGQTAQPQSSLFQPSSSTNLFGNNVAFGSSNVGTGTTIKFNPVTGTDTMQKSGATTTINTKHHCITCMKEYEGKSFEELRLEDYQANRKGPQSQFGSTPFGGTPSMFGQTTENKPAFGQTTSFGQIGGTSTFGQQSSSFGLTSQPSSTTNIFGKPPAFGTSGTTTTGFGGFNTTSNATNAFGTNQVKPFGTSTATPLFGTTQPQQQTTAFGNNLFGQNNQNTTGSFFNKPAPMTAFGTTGFSFNQTPATTTSSLFQPSKPVFGLTSQPTTSVFGQTNAFGQPNQQTAFGASPFGKPAFGQNQTTFQPAGQSSLFPNTQQKPGSLLGGGGMGGGLFGNMNFGTNTTPAFNISQQNIQIQNQGLSMDAANQESKNLSLLTNNQFGHNSFLTGLVPVDKSSSPTFYTTNPTEIKKMLENNKKVDEKISNIKLNLKLGPPKTQRDNLFEEGNDEDVNRFYKTSCKRLVLKKKQDEPKQSIFETDSIYVDLSGKSEEVLVPPKNSENFSVANSINTPDADNASLLRSNESSLFEIKYINKNFHNKHVEKDATKGLTATMFNSSMNLTEGQIKKFDSPKVVEDYTKKTVSETTISEPERSIIREPPISHMAGGGDAPTICGISLKRAEYYTLPPIEELDQLVTEDGRCMVKGFTVGRRGYGNVYFPDELNVKNLDLDEIVHFRYKEINMYPDEKNKPPLGEGLNRRAQVTLDRVYPRMKETKEIIDDVDQVLAAKFPEQLVEISARHGLKFVDYRPETGSWVFMVEHFSKYAFTESDEEGCELGLETDIIESETELPVKFKKAPHFFNDKNMKRLKGAKEKQMVMDVATDSISEKKSKLFPEMERELFPKGSKHVLESTDTDLASEYTDEGDNRQGDVLHKSLTIDLEENDDFINPIYEPTDHDIFYHNSHIQLMKATFFSESECATTVSSIESPPSPKNGFIKRKARRGPPQRPKVWKIYVNIASRPTDSLLLRASRCYSDLGNFKGNSFKVGWSVGFRNYTVKFPINSDFDNSMFLSLSTISQEKSSDIFKESLTECIKLAQECSEYTTDGKDKIPTLRIMRDRTYLMACHKVFKKATSESNGNTEFLYHDVWSLCNALWGPGRRSMPFVKNRLSAWLKNSLEKEPYFIEASRTRTVKKTLSIILNLLTRFKVKEAAEEAMDANMPTLSLIISQINLSQKVKAQIHHQVETWYKDMYSDHISYEMMKIYLLLSGNPYNSNINVCEGLDWKKAFGVHLWYLISEGAPIQAAIEAYSTGFSSHYSAAPHPAHKTNSFDILYHILQLYKNPTYRLIHALNPETYTRNVTDYQLSWILLLFFRSIEVGLIDECEETQIHTSFSSQLENDGLWDYAILPLLYLRDNTLKKNLVLGILNRNLPLVDDAKTQHILFKLTQDFHIPLSWIDCVKAEKKNYSHEK